MDFTLGFKKRISFHNSMINWLIKKYFLHQFIPGLKILINKEE